MFGSRFGVPKYEGVIYACRRYTTVYRIPVIQKTSWIRNCQDGKATLVFSAGLSPFPEIVVHEGGGWNPQLKM